MSKVMEKAPATDEQVQQALKDLADYAIAIFDEELIRVEEGSGLVVVEYDFSGKKPKFFRGLGAISSSNTLVINAELTPADEQDTLGIPHLTINTFGFTNNEELGTVEYKGRLQELLSMPNGTWIESTTIGHASRRSLGSSSMNTDTKTQLGEETKLVTSDRLKKLPTYVETFKTHVESAKQ